MKLYTRKLIRNGTSNVVTVPKTLADSYKKCGKEIIPVIFMSPDEDTEVIFSLLKKGELNL